ncbi:MAG TPA: ATP-binding protein [Thermoanaerobaculia bacterium]|nr:ATP-binding protein [Thermoanaerobaculia bacterium]
MLWSAFAALVVLVALGVTLNITILSVERNQEQHALKTEEPLLDAVDEMDAAVNTMIAAARGYSLTKASQFEAQYEEAKKDFNNKLKDTNVATDPQDMQTVAAFNRYFKDIASLCDKQIDYSKNGRDKNAEEEIDEVARVQRSAPDFFAEIVKQHRETRQANLDRTIALRQGLILAIVIASLAIIMSAAFAIWRIERSLDESIARQVARTEAVIGAMADGVMLVDAEGRTVFINPAGQKMIGNETGAPIFRHAEAYGLRAENGEPLDARELPAAQALATSRAVNDVTMTIVRGEGEMAVSMSAVPLLEDRRVAGAVVTFRNVTERRRLEEEMAQQAQRAQTLADAGAFFTSNIDPVWVTQAIAERTAEVLGDWAAVILKSGDSKELRVAALYHRDMASLGLAWSYIYRQPLTVGEGIIGQVVATGYPSLTSNVGAPQRGEEYSVAGAISATPMTLASLLILPLRTRREMLGALIIAANDPERGMTDENLPLAELLAERAALAIENAKLYTEQVDARRKVEDLSRLKDEFLSIASHELRTPVTSIKGYTQLAKTLIREGDLNTSEEYLEIALDQIDRMSRLILELLDVSRIETGRLEIRREPIHWPNFVRDVVHHHHTSFSDRRFHLTVPEKTNRIVNGDRDRLEQVLGNLLENAVKYSPEASDIYVVVEERTDSVVTAICDRGIGIPADELQQVFERFHRGRQVSSTNYGGLGLGLYITKQIIERHGGSIWVESKEGTGTTFFFSLPTEHVTDAEPVDQAHSLART